jgi:hypothetical protein
LLPAGAFQAKLLQERNQELFFRFDGREVRVIFAPRYRPLDNFEILEQLAGLGYGPATQVQCCLDAEFMSLSIPDGDKTFAVNGDRLTPGICLSNSEVGLASLRIAAFYLRLVCTNGLIARTRMATAYRHVSRKLLDHFPAVFQEVSGALIRQRDLFRLSMESRVDDPQSTMRSFYQAVPAGGIGTGGRGLGLDVGAGPHHVPHRQRLHPGRHVHRPAGRFQLQASDCGWPGPGFGEVRKGGHGSSLIRGHLFI